MLATHSHPYALQALMFYLAIAVPAALIVLIVGNALYHGLRRHRRPPAH